MAIIERKQVLNKLNIAITDIGKKVLRQNNSSLDNNIFPIEFTDIFKIIYDNPSIKTIILTSSTKGNSVLSWFSIYCSINGIKLFFDKKIKEYPKSTTINVSGNKIMVFVVYSTSGAAGKSEDDLVKQYQKVINYKTKEIYI